MRATAASRVYRSRPMSDAQRVITTAGGGSFPRLSSLDGSTFVAAAGATAVEAATAVNTEDLRRAYYDGPGGGWEWWVREIDLDPAQLIVENEAEGELYRVPYTISSSGEITFGEAIQVRVEFVDAAAGRSAEARSAARFVAASRQIGPRVPIDTWATRAESRPAAAAAQVQPTSTPSNEPEEGNMLLTKEQLAKLGLPEDATDEQVSAKLDELTAATAENEGGGDGGGTTPVETPQEPGTGSEPGVNQKPDTAQPTQPAEAPAPPATESKVDLPEGMTLIDDAVLAQLQEGVREAGELVAAAKTAAKDSVLDGALRAGKIPKARREHYGKLYDLDPEGTKQALAAMPSGLIPVEELGDGGGDGGGELAEGEAYPASWGRQVQAAHRGMSRRVKVVGD